MPGAATQMPTYTEESEDSLALSSTREELQPPAVSADWALRGRKVPMGGRALCCG